MDRGVKVMVRAETENGAELVLLLDVDLAQRLAGELRAACERAEREAVVLQEAIAGLLQRIENQVVPEGVGSAGPSATQLVRVAAVVRGLARTPSSSAFTPL